MAIVTVILSLCQLAAARFMVSESVLRVVYGNISQIRDLALPPELSRRSGDDQKIEYGDHEPMPEFHEYYDELHEIEEWSSQLPNKSDLDMKDLHETTKMVKDLKKSLDEVIKDHQMKTRRSVNVEVPSEVSKLWRDPVQIRIWYYMKMTLTYLMHIRFQVDSAIRFKMVSVDWNGYKIGYLFSRLVKLKFQLYRIMEEWVSMKTDRKIQNRPNWRTQKHSLSMFLQLYEQALHLEVDMKDTCDMIKLLFNRRPLFTTELATDKSKPFMK